MRQPRCARSLTKHRHGASSLGRLGRGTALAEAARMISTRLALCSLLGSVLAGCPASSEQAVDGGVSADGVLTADAAADAPTPCTTNGKVYVAERLGPKLKITTHDDVITGGMAVAEVTCGAETTGLGVLKNGAMFAALTGGAIARVTATECTALTIAPALAGDVALVGRGDELLALRRADGMLWRIDPTSGAATLLSTVPGSHVESSLVGGSEGVMVYLPAELGGQGALIPIGAAGQPGPRRTVSGASTHQAQANWVSVVGDAGKLWLTMAGYFGAGGSPRTMWIPFQNDQLQSATVEYYASTVAATAATCP